MFLVAAKVTVAGNVSDRLINRNTMTGFGEVIVINAENPVILFCFAFPDLYSDSNEEMVGYFWL